uniref:Uncharacterized protein n=1 Tax=Methylophaga nitratireducenticrescens TaxID=754476 RepID=I1XJ43_METNJ
MDCAQSAGTNSGLVDGYTGSAIEFSTMANVDLAGVDHP